ncbi:hypothetical protein [Xanthomonas sp. 60]
MKTSLLSLALLSLVSAPALAQSDDPADAGELHNTYLACLLDHGGPSAATALAVLVDGCGYPIETSREEFIRTFQPTLEVDYSQPLTRLMAGEREAYGETAFAFFERIDDVLATSTDFDEVDARLAALQKEAMETLPEKTEARELILQSLTLGRGSAAFWHKVEGRLDSRQAVRRGWFGRLMAVVGADLKSYVSSFSIGAAAGASAVAGVNQIGEASGWW